MAKYTFTSDGSETFYFKRGTNISTAKSSGGFGGGTLSFVLVDEDSNDATITDDNGPILHTAANITNFYIGTSNNTNEDKLGLKVTMTGSSSPTARIIVTNAELE